jgi:hypothetical protein
MVCDIILRRMLGLGSEEILPSPEELQQMVGAGDHEEFHAIINSMDPNELEELRILLSKWRKKKFGIAEFAESTVIG